MLVKNLTIYFESEKNNELGDLEKIFLNERILDGNNSQITFAKN